MMAEVYVSNTLKSLKLLGGTQGGSGGSSMFKSLKSLAEVGGGSHPPKRDTSATGRKLSLPVAGQAISVSIEACRTIARQRWGRCTAFRMGIVAGEIGARIVNPYRGKQASLFREGLRRTRPTRAQAGVKARELGVRLDWGLGYWEVLG